MPHRHWGIRSTKPPVPAGPTAAAGWSGGAFVSIILVITIVLGIVLYAVSNTVTDVANRGRASHDWARSRCAHTERDGAVESDERQEAGRGAEGQRGRGRIGQKASAQLYSNAHSTALFVSKSRLK